VRIFGRYTRYVTTPAVCGLWSVISQDDQASARAPDDKCMVIPSLQLVVILQSQSNLQHKNFKIATLTYKTHPAYLREPISPYQPSRSLRSSNQLLLTVPRVNLTISQRAFSYSSPVIWNAIPLSARDAPSISSLKRRLKPFFFRSFVS